jgi:hypothetical protein
MMIDQNIHFRKRGAADIAGGFREGFTIGDMIKKAGYQREDRQYMNQERKRQKKAREQKAANDRTIKGIFQRGVIQNPDGTSTLDREGTLSELYKHSPEIALQYESQWLKDEDAKQRRKDQEVARKINEQKLKESQKPYKDSREAAKAEFHANLKKKNNPVKGDQYKVGGFAKRAIMAEADLARLPKDVGTGEFWDTLQGSSIFPEGAKSENRKLFEQTQRNFISAVLRRESGAAISDQEMENESKKYFPQPGDGPQVLAQKARSRKQAIMNLRAEAGGAMDRIATAPQARPQTRAQDTSIPGIQDAHASPMSHPKVNAAIKWARENRNDPRAIRILEKLGAK